MTTKIYSKVMWVGKATVFLMGLAVILALVLALIGPEREAHATHLDPEIEVTTTADELNSDGDCSLREAIESANLVEAVDACTAPDPEDNRSLVFLPDGTYVLDKPDSGSLVVTERVYLRGEGAGNTIIDGANRFMSALVVKNASGSLFSTTVHRLTIRNFNSSALHVDQGAGVTLLESVVTDNEALTGGGIVNAGSAVVSQSTISANDGGARAGGIANSSGADLTVIGSTIRDNVANSGAGITNSGHLIVTNSTISGNKGELRGGGIVNTATTHINNSTITNNVGNTRREISDTYQGGGIRNVSPATVTLSNTILAGNTDGLTGTSANGIAGPDCYGTLTSNRNNIIGNNHNCIVDDPNSEGTPFDQVGTPTNPIDPLLEPLAANIGRTWTHALRPGSPAIDRGSSLTPGSGSFACEPIDQRFAPRPADGNGDGTAVCDIGAFELQPPANDNFANAQFISGASTTVNGTNVLATRDSGEPNHLPSGGSLGENTVWYNWTAPSSGQVNMDTCTSSFDTTLAVYTGSALSTLSQVGSDDDSCDTPNGAGSRLSFNATAGTTYQIAVGGFHSNSVGTFTFNLVTVTTSPPMVMSTSPDNGATQIAPGVDVTATFTKAMDASTTDGDPSTIKGTTFKLFRVGTSTAIGAVVSYNATAKKATLNPNANLRLGTKYKAVVTTGAEDLAGNRLDQNSSQSGLQQKVWTFTIRN